MVEHYKGWKIIAYRQKNYHPYLDYVAHATKEIAPKKLIGFNVEGNTLEEALNKAKEKIDDTEWDSCFNN